MTTPEIKLKSVVVGLGAIGSGYDLDDAEAILSHARAYAKHEAFELIGGVDVNPENRDRFTDTYGLPTYREISDLIASQLSVDIISLCTPTSLHGQHLKAVVSTLSPKVILCEKPLSYKLSEAEDMVSLCREKNIILAVNYWRRSEPGVNALKRKIERDELGALRHGIVWYQRGMINNASHFIDLLNFLFGSPSETALLSLLDDKASPEFFSMNWCGAEVLFKAVDDCSYNFFEMTLLFEHGTVDYKNAGREISIRKVDKTDKPMGYSQLDVQSDLPETDFNRYQFYVLEDILKHLDKKEPLKSDGESALDSLSCIDKIDQLLNKNNSHCLGVCGD